MGFEEEVMQCLHSSDPVARSDSEPCCLILSTPTVERGVEYSLSCMVVVFLP